MKWFQLDSDAPNDPKLKTVIRVGIEPNKNQSAAGALFLLWCCIANQGKGEPGLGVRADGSPLELTEIAGECMFNSVPDLEAFLDVLSGQKHIHPAVWTERRVVFLPAMWERVSAYYRSKARKMEFESVEQVAEATLAGTVHAHGGPKPPTRANPAPHNKTRQNTTKQKIKSVAPPVADLLADGGQDQVQALVDLWNTERKPGPMVQGLTDSRRRAIGAALKLHPNLTDWRNVIRYLNGEKWCNASGTGDHPNWRMDLDHLVKPGKFLKALENMAVKRPVAADGTVGRDASKGRTGGTPGKFAGL